MSLVRSILSSTLVLLGWLVAPGAAQADEIGPQEESCQRKEPSAACALPNGAAGVCVSRTDARGRTRLTCESAPPPAASATPGAAPSASASPTVKRGCAIGLSSDPTGFGATTAAVLALAALRRRQARLRLCGERDAAR